MNTGAAWWYKPRFFLRKESKLNLKYHNLLQLSLSRNCNLVECRANEGYWRQGQTAILIYRLLRVGASEQRTWKLTLSHYLQTSGLCPNKQRSASHGSYVFLSYYETTQKFCTLKLYLFSALFWPSVNTEYSLIQIPYFLANKTHFPTPPRKMLPKFDLRLMRRG